MKSILLAVLLCLTAAACSKPGEPSSVKLPDGNTVTTTSTTVEPLPQKIRLLTADELLHVADLRRRGDIFVHDYLPEIHTPTLKDYDRAFRAWQISKSRKYSNANVIEVIGSFLGDTCVKELDMEWVEVTDAYGTDLAVRSKKVEVISFPYSSVAKRVEKNEFEFVYSLFHTIKQMQSDGSVKPR